MVLCVVLKPWEKIIFICALRGQDLYHTTTCTIMIILAIKPTSIRTYVHVAQNVHRINTQAQALCSEALLVLRPHPQLEYQAGPNFNTRKAIWQPCDYFETEAHPMRPDPILPSSSPQREFSRACSFLVSG